MNLKIKSSLIIIGTFILGMVVGSIFIKSFFPPPEMREKMERLRKPEGFMRNFERVIKPNESQREQIRDILQDHFERIQKHSFKFRELFMQLNDSLRAELDPILTEDQKERLDKMEKRMKERTMPGMGHRPPHHPGEYPDRKKRPRD